MKSESQSQQIFSKEEIQNISALGDVLRQISIRLKRDGVSVEDARAKILPKLEK